jgi:4-hydroxy-tetrahydrodipicolinate synthase
MVTPFTERDTIDYAALEKQVEWYIERGAAGLFAVCQSSEMFRLTLEERAAIASFVTARAGERLPVVASGHVSDAFEDQVREIRSMAETGVDAVVLLTNRLAQEDESEEVWIERMDLLLRHIPEQAALGLYECPYPYKRLLSDRTIRWCADTGRFRFLKDTSCDAVTIRARIEAVKGSGLQIYNANSATLLESLRFGAAGYSGVMANFHPELYARLCADWQEQGDGAERLSDFLSVSALIEKQIYPMNAKYHMMLEGVYTNCRCRVGPGRSLSPTEQLEVEQLRRLSARYHAL